MIFFQYITDLFDGAVGRYRNTGLVRWGYYMDHLLDYLFLCSVLIGYSFILPDRFKYLLFFILAIFGAFMVNSYLAFAVTNKFKIAYLKIGPTEIRILFIVINTLLIIFGKTYMGEVLPFILFLSLAGLCFVVYKTQKYIWKLDMANKKSKEYLKN
jgi:phosphatidylglycerophosphate synthase